MRPNLKEFSGYIRFYYSAAPYVCTCGWTTIKTPQNIAKSNPILLPTMALKITSEQCQQNLRIISFTKKEFVIMDALCRGA